MQKKNKQFVVMSVILALVGLGFIIGGIALSMSDENFKKTAKETTAIITEIHSSRDIHGDETHIVYVNFFVNGRKYEGKLGYWYRGMAKGQSVKVYYHPDNPQNFRGIAGLNGGRIMTLLGAICFLIGSISLYKQNKRTLSNKTLLTSGKKVMAPLNDVIRGNVSVNGRNCRNLICEYKDETTGNVYLFKSENIWVDPPSLGDRQMPSVPVYVDYNDYSKYYVDVDAFFAAVAGSSDAIDYTRGSAHMQWSDDKHDDLSSALKVTGTTYDLGGFIVLWILMIFGGGIIYFWKQTGLIFTFIGLFFVGVGIFAHVKLFQYKFSRPKEVQAQLVAIDKGGEYRDYAGKSLYVLKFQDEKGKIYFYPTNDIGHLKEKNIYKITVKSAIVLEIGFLVSKSMQSIV